MHSRYSWRRMGRRGEGGGRVKFLYIYKRVVYTETATSTCLLHSMVKMETKGLVGRGEEGGRSQEKGGERDRRAEGERRKRWKRNGRGTGKLIMAKK